MTTSVLRLRKRRDGTLALTDAARQVNGPDREFPAEFVFTPTLVMGSGGAVRLAGDRLLVELVNGRAEYAVTGVRPNGELAATLASSELFDAPPVDEAKAETVAAEARAAAVAGLARDAGIDTETAERVLVAQGRLPSVAAPKDGEV